jgi:hypothetical protein
MHYGRRTDVCDSCVTRRENYVQRGGNAKIDGTVETTTIHHNPGNLWYVLLFFCGQSRINCGCLRAGFKAENWNKMVSNITC